MAKAKHSTLVRITVQLEQLTTQFSVRFQATRLQYTALEVTLAPTRRRTETALTCPLSTE
jgi:hypothetical protein